MVTMSLLGREALTAARSLLTSWTAGRQIGVEVDPLADGEPLNIVDGLYAVAAAQRETCAAIREQTRVQIAENRHLRQEMDVLRAELARQR